MRDFDRPVEGEADDITGRGQTEAALALCTKLPKAKKRAYVQPKVGHYGVFNGSRWRTEIQPKVAKFMRMAADEARKRPAMKMAAE